MFFKQILEAEPRIKHGLNKVWPRTAIGATKAFFPFSSVFKPWRRTTSLAKAEDCCPHFIVIGSAGALDGALNQPKRTIGGPEDQVGVVLAEGLQVKDEMVLVRH